jgi:glycosyltransferase involved in cell wall biosynthesis
MQNPIVSVVITAFNRERYIEQAVSSILDQTFQDFELIIVDDGSTDSTLERLARFSDPRIRLVEHGQNRGIPAARNSGLEAAEGKFIAWLDSDDIALPHRLNRQINYLGRNQDIAMVGACASKISAPGQPLRGTRIPPLSHEVIRSVLLFRSAFQQSSIVGRSSVLKRHPYRQEFPVCEDVDMFVRTSSAHRVENMPEVLIRRRIHSDQTIRSSQDRIKLAQARISRPILEQLGITFTEDELHRHALLAGSFGGRPDSEYLEWAGWWTRNLIRANDKSRVFDVRAFRLAATFFLLRAFAQSGSGVRTFRRLFTPGVLRGVISRDAASWLRQAALVSSRERRMVARQR